MPGQSRLMFCWEKAGATPLRTSRQCLDLLLCVSMFGILARLLICGARANSSLLELLMHRAPCLLSHTTLMGK